MTVMNLLYLIQPLILKRKPPPTSNDFKLLLDNKFPTRKLEI